MEKELRAVEQLFTEQASQIDQLQRSHAALARALCSLRSQHYADMEDSVRKAKEINIKQSSQPLAVGHIDATPPKHIPRAEEEARSTPPKLLRPSTSPEPSHSDSHSRAMQVLAIAHEMGYSLKDMPGLTAEEWQRLGATPADREIVLGALGDSQGHLETKGENDKHLHASKLLDGAQRQLQGHGRGDVFGDDGLPKGIGNGKRHVPVRDGVVNSGVSATAVGPGTFRRENSISGYRKGADGHPQAILYGGGVHCRTEDPGMADGLDRDMGHGRHTTGAEDHLRGGGVVFANGGDDANSRAHRRHVAVKDHMWGGYSVEERCGPGELGHVKDTDYEGGLQRGIGHGRRHFDNQPKDRIYNGGADGHTQEAHGHPKGDDHEGVLQQGGGHGQRHTSNGHDASRVKQNVHFDSRTAAVRSPSAPAALRSPSTPALAGIAAGVPSRYAGAVHTTACGLDNPLWRQAPRSTWA